MFTRFMDMHSGGSQKEKFAYCYIEAPEDVARVVFHNRFGHDPENVTCSCCGDDYSIAESETLEEATAYERNCEFAYFFDDTGEYAGKETHAKYDGTQKAWCISGRPVSGKYIEEQDFGKMRIRESCNTSSADKWGIYVPLSEYISRDDVAVIRAGEITDSDKR